MTNKEKKEFLAAMLHGHAKSGITPQRDLMQVCMRMKPNFAGTSPQSVIDNCNIKVIIFPEYDIY